MRQLVIAALLYGLVPSAAAACMVKPPSMSQREIASASTAIIQGRFQYGYRNFPGTNVGYTVGRIVPRKMLKGALKPNFRVSHEEMDLACQGWGWEPQRNRRPKEYVGYFYLFSNDDGTYSVARYSQKAGR